jgi:filamentous hemagglutinin family protein
MKKHLLHILTTTTLFLLPHIAQAQTYTPSNRIPQADNSIGTIVNPTGTNNFNIDGGLQRGQNLFHSFTDFSIPTGGAANFTNPAGNQSIITRVTGDKFSDINGTLNTNGANFLLINPNGVVFGTDARLDVGKAFVTSTASGVDFVDAAGRNYNFGVNKAGDAPLISIDPNVAFNPARLVMGETIPGSKGIENYGTLQTNNVGQYIGLIGGDVNFYGGQLIAPGAKIELGGLVQSGAVGFSLDNGVQFPANVERGNVSLVTRGTSPSIIDVRAGGGGSVGIFAKDITLQGRGTKISGAIAAGLSSPTATAGDIKLDATRNVILSEGFISNNVNSGGVGKGGNIEINTRNLSLTNAAQLNASTFGQGDAGSIKITASGDISFDGSSAALSQVAQSAIGKGGNIEINTRNLSLTNGAQLSAVTIGQGDVGNIKITASGDISFDGSSAAFSQVAQRAIGKGGNIEINTRNLSLTNGAQLNANTSGQGDAGGVKITATGNVSFDGSSAAFSSISKDGVGKGGNIEITTNNLAVTNGAQLNASTVGKGDAGSVKITATGNVSFDNGYAFSSILKDGVGKGGNIEIKTDNLAVTNGAQLSASTVGKGDAGSVKVTAKDVISIAGGGSIFSTVELASVGKGGNIDIVAGSLSLKDGSQVSTTIQDANGTQPTGTGDAGNITVKVSGAVDIAGKRNIYSSGILSFVGTDAGGKGGNVTIDAGSFSLRDGAQLSTATYGRGNAGNLTVNATNFVTIAGKSGSSTSGLFVDSQSPTGTAGDLIVTAPQITVDGGKINAGSFTGNGGNIKIQQADLLLLRRGGQITTNADGTPQSGGNGGNISINSKFIVAIPTENSDISANAVKGRGGNVNINAQGLFGIQFRPQKTDNSDITASSDFGLSGNVQINTPGIDPGKDTGELPAAPNDASNQISQTCGASQRENKFYITGRGGLPPNASEPQESEALWQDARATKTKPATTANQPAQLAPPAIGWVFEKDGRVRLIAAQTAGGATRTKVVCPGK